MDMSSTLAGSNSLNMRPLFGGYPFQGKVFVQFKGKRHYCDYFCCMSVTYHLLFIRETEIAQNMLYVSLKSLFSHT